MFQVMEIINDLHFCNSIGKIGHQRLMIKINFENPWNP